MQDYESYKKMSICQQQITVSNKFESDHSIEASSTEILTHNDLDLVRNGLAPQQYDAFILHAEEDGHYVEEMISKLENSEYHFKVTESN